MTRQLRQIWDSINRVLTVINLVLWAFITFSPTSLKKDQYKKIPVVVNVLLLLALTFVVGLYDLPLE
jgi:hypothetical protein